MDIRNSDYLMTWISHAFKVDAAEYCSNSSELVPRLDRWLASELLKVLKRVPDLQFQFRDILKDAHATELLHVVVRCCK